MNPRVENHIAHYARRPAAVVDCDHRATCGKCWQPESLFQSNHNVAVFHVGTTLPQQHQDHCEQRNRRQRRAHLRPSLRRGGYIRSRSHFHRGIPILFGHVQPLQSAVVARSASSFPVQLLRMRGGVACTEPYRSERRTLAKPSVRKVGRPTDLSETRSRTSASSFSGVKTLHRASRPHAAAAFGKPSVFLAAIANGRARHKPRSSLKFCLVRACGT